MRGRVLVAVGGLLAATFGLAREGPAGPPAEQPPAGKELRRWIASRDAESRAKALAKYGADAASEKAVDAGLDWLARHAEPSGGWDADGFPARCDPAGPKCDGIGKGQHGEEMPCPFDDAISALSVMAF